MSDLIELKPCPFCGGDAEHAEGKYGDGKTWHYVECVGCGATGPNLEYAAHNIDVKGYRADTWNTRALIETTAERDEALNQLDSTLHSVDVLEKRVETLLAERDHLRAKVNGMQALCDDLVGEVEKAVAERTEELRHQVERYGDLIDRTAELDALRALLTEARDDLEEYANADWPEPSRSQYPDIMRRWKRDMDLCWRIDAALQKDTPND